MSLAFGVARADGQGFPRVSGDEPFNVFSVIEREEFSPRERG